MSWDRRRVEEARGDRGRGAFGFLYLDKAKAEAGFSAWIGVKNSLIVLDLIKYFSVLESKGKWLEEMSWENEDNKAPVRR